MSESLNIERTGNYEARVKAILVTGMAEADRQWETWNLSNEAQRSLRRTAGLNENEPTGSVVKSHPGNWDSGCAEPLLTWRRQYCTPTHPVMMCRHPGVTGQACGEGYLREDGRSRISPVKWHGYTELIESSIVSSVSVIQSLEVKSSISRSETTVNGVREVRQVHSRNEIPVTGIDTKGPDFCCASFEEQGGPSLRKRSSTWA